MKEDVIYYEQLAIGAEYLASMTFDSDERVEHLKMAGTYHRRARLAGSTCRPLVLH